MIIRIKKFLYRKRRWALRKKTQRRLKRLIMQLKPLKTNYELIRLGKCSDGGYLVPNDLDNIKACFSAGVGDECSFEIACSNHGMVVFMADGSVEKPPVENYSFNFKKKFIGSKNSKDYITLKKWIKDCEQDFTGDLILQMDVEGAEFEILNSVTTATLKKFRIVIIEFHNLNLLSEKAFYQKVSSSFRKILKNHFCIHIHPNNCCGIKKVEGFEIPVVAEFTFIRKDRVQFSSKANKFPHQLDCDNVDRPSILLPEIWYQ